MYKIKATKLYKIRFYCTESVKKLVEKVKELKSLGYIVEVK